MVAYAISCCRFKGRKLLLFTNAWSITWAEEHNKELRLSEVGR